MRALLVVDDSSLKLRELSEPAVADCQLISTVRVIEHNYRISGTARKQLGNRGIAGEWAGVARGSVDEKDPNAG